MAKRTWTQESAAKVIKAGGVGLTYCSAYDYYKKTFGQEELDKLFIKEEKPNKKNFKKERNEEVVNEV